MYSNYEYQIDADGGWKALSPASTSTSFTITGLENGETYTVSVRAVNAKGSGANSEPVTATLVQQKISIPTPDNDTVELNITSESGGRLGTNCTISSWEVVPAPGIWLPCR